MKKKKKIPLIYNKDLLFLIKIESISDNYDLSLKFVERCFHFKATTKQHKSRYFIDTYHIKKNIYIFT